MSKDLAPQERINGRLCQPSQQALDEISTKMPSVVSCPRQAKQALTAEGRSRNIERSPLDPRLSPGRHAPDIL